MFVGGTGVIGSTENTETVLSLSLGFQLDLPVGQFDRIDDGFAVVLLANSMVFFLTNDAKESRLPETFFSGFLLGCGQSLIERFDFFALACLRLSTAIENDSPLQAPRSPAARVSAAPCALWFNP